MARVNDRTWPRSAVVTGGARGIGRAIAEALTEAGWAVVTIDLRPSEAPSAPAGERIARTVAGDVSQRETHNAAAATARTIAPLRAWVNNAALSLRNDLHVPDDDLVRRVLDTNLLGVYLGCSTAVEAMLEQGLPGAIVNISSIHARAGFPGWAAYDAAKGGVESLTRHVAAAYGAFGIRANAVSPGTVWTPNLDEHLQASGDPAAMRDELADLAPLKRIGEAREVADAVAFLVSERASYITGAVLAVDGGLSAIVQPPEATLKRRR